MGSFANSLHIKSARADVVSDAIRDILLDEGYQITDQEPDEQATWGMPSALRALYVTEAYQGWTGVLDSGLMSSTTLASELSGRLKTHVIQFLVNDSDSWHYLLYSGGEQLDEFDSSGGQEAEIEEISPDLAKILRESGPAAMQQEVERRVQEVQRQIEDAMPPEIREIHRKMEQRTANAEETWQHTEWMQSHVQQFMDGMKETLYGEVPPPESRIAEDDLEQHAEQLRPLLGPDITQDRVLEVLGKQAVFAEEVLGEFMEVLGIQPFFANLSYRYLEECSASELLAANIKLADHLKFKRQPERRLGIFRPS